MEGGVVGRKRGMRGQRKGQIYFLCAVDLDDGPLWGHRGLSLRGLPQGRRPIGLHAHFCNNQCVCTFFCTSAHMCVYVCARLHA